MNTVPLLFILNSSFYIDTITSDNLTDELYEADVDDESSDDITADQEQYDNSNLVFTKHEGSYMKVC